MFEQLVAFLQTVPGIEGHINQGSSDSGWWLKFKIDIQHELAWHVVQELGHILNYVAINAHLPTRFMPVSPPPYINGGPAEFLSWVIECDNSEFTPDEILKWLEGRLPKPVNDPKQWWVTDS